MGTMLVGLEILLTHLPERVYAHHANIVVIRAEANEFCSLISRMHYLSALLNNDWSYSTIINEQFCCHHSETDDLGGV